MSFNKEKVNVPFPWERPYSDSKLLQRSTALVSLPARGQLAPLQRRSVSAGGLAACTKADDGRGQVALWPAKAPRKKVNALTTRSTSKAPLALQLEGFIRKEHRQYLSEHPQCTRADTLHIFREAFGAFVQHFPEYTSVLHVIRDEYDSTIEEMKEQVKQMRVIDLENKSDRSVHAMELMQLKESLTAVISNQQAQIEASQGLVFSLRDQLAVAEHANNLLKFELERNMREYDDAKDKAKLVSQAMIEESARTASILEALKKKEKENDLMNARVHVLTKSVAEMEDCLLHRARQDMERATGSEDATAPGGAGARHSAAPVPSTYALTADDDPRAPGNDEYVARLQARIDALEFELESCNRTAPGCEDAALPDPEEAPPVLKKDERQPVETQFPIIGAWLRDEGVAEEDLEEGERLLPPGLWPSEEFAFLKATQPLRNRHLSRRDVVSLVTRFWEERERQVNSSGIQTQPFFLEWLTKESASAYTAKELGLNLLMGCSRHVDHPDCRTLLQALRGFIPEAVVPASRRLLRHLRKCCDTSTDLINGTHLPFEVFFDLVRVVYPEKSAANMLQLRFFAFRECRETVHIGTMLDPASYFVVLLKQQFYREVEQFTLAVVEGIRETADAVGNSVTIANAIKVIQSVDPAMNQAMLHALMAEACQRSVVDIATTSDSTTVRLEVLLNRFRTAVLLRRCSPVDLP
ncbi:hypothetical protein STCU_01186 [Strigomonas culicis]|uniref:Translin-associated factor X-interacting protein 1 N-terminal domain-containing protein n=1 Tax=Strigomonas culicis TaxID=28005 RepID=S9VHT3_9TRYP|nr:hypothetical protein STCU_08776 [Strigomonas culicis]EPY26641.1 hypothetical protein STCU_06153 [Strigomonas culicis]EPY35228.1 hypothetical protein STCU_01186 [Strigomonas culicis]|eukprot:EPY20918.1 hypothetical protein STCU_08776 [Strigomonas culicis]